MSLQPAIRFLRKGRRIGVDQAAHDWVLLCLCKLSLALLCQLVVGHQLQVLAVVLVGLVETILEAVRSVVAYLRSMSPVWRDLQNGKTPFVIP